MPIRDVKEPDTLFMEDVQDTLYKYMCKHFPDVKFKKSKKLNVDNMSKLVTFSTMGVTIGRIPLIYNLLNGYGDGMVDMLGIISKRERIIHGR